MNERLITLKIEEGKSCGFVYAVMPEGDLVKIGGSVNFCTRPMQHMTGKSQHRSLRNSPKRGIILALYLGKDYLSMEAELLRILWPLNIRTHYNASREVFKVSPEIKEQIIASFENSFSAESLQALDQLVVKTENETTK